MKHLIYSFTLALFLLASCSDDDQIPTCENCSFTCIDENDPNVITNSCIDNWECNFNILPNAKVDVNADRGSSNGANNVFQIINKTQGSVLIADDEFTNILVFELDESQTSFSVDNNELQALNTHFNRVCYCSDIGFRAVTSGCMQGEQIGGIWFVQGDLTIAFDFDDIEFKFDVQFEN